MKEQYIHINEYGGKSYYSDREMTIRHREDGPAIEWADGGKSWFRDGEYHREDGPAIEWACGDKEWCLNGEYHREDGPAIERANGGKVWYLNGKLHREDGPAVEYADGGKEWYLNGKLLSEAEFNARMSPAKELTLDEIAAKFGVSVDKLKIKK